jgi:hypothetical protein
MMHRQWEVPGFHYARNLSAVRWRNILQIVSHGRLIATRINGAIRIVIRQMMVWYIPIGRALSMPTSLEINENLQVTHSTTEACLYTVV